MKRISHKKVLSIIALIPLIMTGAFITEGQNKASLVTYAVKTPEHIEAGKPFSIDIIFNVEPGWYIYAPTGVNADLGMIETNVRFNMPDGVVRNGNVSIPKPVLMNGHEIYEGQSITMSQSFKTLKPGSYDVRGKVIWQTCSGYSCLPPVTDEFTLTIQTD